MRVIDHFDKVTAAHAGRTAFIGDGEAYSYGEIFNLSHRIAAAMQDRGLDKDANDRVAVYAPNNVRAFVCILATFRAGGVWVPINAKNTIRANIDFMNLCECRWLFYHSSFAELIEQIRAEVPSLEHLVCIDGDTGASPSLDAFIEDTDGCLAATVPPDPDRIATIFGSGGTTGRSKGIVWTNLVWDTMIAETCISMRVEERPIHLCVAPMTHAAGVLTFMLMPQAPTNVVLEKTDPLAIMQAIERHRATHLFLPPTALYAMLAHPRVREFDYFSLTHFLLAASPVSPDKLAEAVAVFGPCICQCYGQAEAPMLITYFSPEEIVAATRDRELRHRLKSCGKAGTLSLVSLMGDDGTLLPEGERGEVVLQGNLVSPGYWRDPTGTAEARLFGWHHTGDIAYCDKDGYYYIVDRKKDMIITGGFNVFSAEVENAVNDHPAVENCAVIGVPDEKWGEAVTAVVVLRCGQTATEAEIIAFVKERVGSVKAPKKVHFWRELPRSPVGKVLKTEIREHFWAGSERAIN